MVECSYCDQDFDGNKTSNEYVDHLAENHYDNIGRIDERLIEENWDGDLATLQPDEDEPFLTPLEIGMIGSFVTFALGIGYVVVI